MVYVSLGTERYRVSLGDDQANRGEMRDAALYEAIVDAREVLESYRVHGILIDEWWSTLSSAATRFVEAGERWSDDGLRTLGHGLASLANDGVAVHEDLAKTLAADVAERLDEFNKTEFPELDAAWAR